VFDYGEGHYREEPPDEEGRVFACADVEIGSDWPARKDTSSTYRSGFEIRTYRLCRRVLMFHHFPEELGGEPYLVRSTAFEYREKPIGSFLTRVAQSAHRRCREGRYLTRSLPPLDLFYTASPLEDADFTGYGLREVDPDDLANLPAGIDDREYRLLDLDGEGIAGVFSEQAAAWLYKPNLGYGRFGAKIVMDASPWFDTPDLFDETRLRLADTDGSGTTDILYLGPEGVAVYLNESGNGWSSARHLPQFPVVDDIASVTVADLLGRGTACLVWSSPLPGEAGRQLRYLDLMCGKKPHLLDRTLNNLGAETRIEYAASPKFYLADKAAGTPWVTRLPFPVHVVERVETFDRVSRNRFVTRYSYHHGFYDGVEREFRGFGRVDQLDTEAFAALSESGSFPQGGNIDTASSVPPVLTRTWYHTGVFLEGGRVSRHLAHEYYQEGSAHRGEGGLSHEQIGVMLLDDTILPERLTPEEAREACRSLKGSMLRQEVYGLDETEAASRPYRVTESNFTIRALQGRGPNRHTVFFTHAREQVSFEYERKLYEIDGRRHADPRVAHAITLEVDVFALAPARPMPIFDPAHRNSTPWETSGPGAPRPASCSSRRGRREDGYRQPCRSSWRRGSNREVPSRAPKRWPSTLTRRRAPRPRSSRQASTGRKLFPAGAPQHASRAMAAAETPLAAIGAVAEIAAVCLVADQLDECVAAEIAGQRPGCGLVAPHQRRPDHKPMIHAERQGRLKCLQRIVATIGIARVIGLAHAADEMAQPASICDRRRQHKEHQIAARNEGVRQPSLAEGDRGLAGQCGIADPAQHGAVDDVVTAEPRIPIRKFAAQARYHRHAAPELDPVALPVIKTDRFDLGKTLERPAETRRRILTAGKEDKRFLRPAYGWFGRRNGHSSRDSSLAARDQLPTAVGRPQRLTKLATRKPTAKATTRLVSGLCSTVCDTEPTALSPWLRNSLVTSRARSCASCAHCSLACAISLIERDAWSITKRSFSIASVAWLTPNPVAVPSPSGRSPLSRFSAMIAAFL
jgi:Insecticide toxin TcdB middle/N-terminal region/Insecticide toxin TcdB middle/C-terminal region/Salmonella virulence plasmid 65kDa B protein